MARSASSIQAEIERIEALLASEEALVESAGANGVNAKRVSYEAMTKRLDRLHQQLGRADGSNPMFVRGRLKDMGYEAR